MNLQDLFSRQNFIFTERFLLTAARSRQTYFFRGLLIITLYITVLGFSKSQGTPSGLNLFRALSGINFFFITFFALKSFSYMITEEKEQGTLGLLMITPHPPISLIAAKSVPILAEILAIFLIEMPLILLSMVFGGIELTQILHIFILLPAYALFIAGVGIYFSCLCQKNQTSAALTFAFLILFFNAPYIIDGFQLIFYPQAPSLNLSQISVWFNPLSQMNAIFSFKSEFTHLVYFSLLSSGVFCLTLWNSCRKLQKIDLTTSSKDTSTKKGKTTVLRKRRAWENAVIGKDFHLGGGKSIYIAKIIGYLLLSIAIYIFLGGFHSKKAPDLREFTMITANFLFIISLIEIIAYAGQAFSIEVKQKQLSSLLSLPYSNSQIIKWKVLSSLLLASSSIFMTLVFFFAFPDRIKLLIKAFYEPPFYLLACLFIATFFTVMYNGLTFKRKRTFVEQVRIAGLGMICFFLIFGLSLMLFNISSIYGALFLMTIALIYSSIVLVKLSQWMTTLAQEEN